MVQLTFSPTNLPNSGDVFQTPGDLVIVGSTAAHLLLGFSRLGDGSLYTLAQLGQAVLPRLFAHTNSSSVVVETRQVHGKHTRKQQVGQAVGELGPNVAAKSLASTPGHLQLVRRCEKTVAHV